MTETGWVRVYRVRADERMLTATSWMEAEAWVEREAARLRALGREVDVTWSRPMKSWTVRVWVPEAPHGQDGCWCGWRHSSAWPAEQGVAA